MSAGAWRCFWYVLGAVVVVAVAYAIGDSIPVAGNGYDHGDDDLGGLFAFLFAYYALVAWSVLVCLTEVLLWVRRIMGRRSRRATGRAVR